MVSVLPAQKLCRGNRESPPVRGCTDARETATVPGGFLGSELGSPRTPGHSAPAAWLTPAWSHKRSLALWREQACLHCVDVTL